MGCMNSVPTSWRTSSDRKATQQPLRLHPPEYSTTARADYRFLRSFFDAERSRSCFIGTFRDVQKRRTLQEVIHAFANPTGEPFVLALTPLARLCCPRS